MATRSTVRTRRIGSIADPENKENKQNGGKTKAKLVPRTASKTSKVHCLCRKPDDGSPMIRCEQCNEWYHFGCVNLAERDAEDIQTYVCPSCCEDTGLRTIMEWEGVTGLEQVGDRQSRSRQQSSTVEDGRDEVGRGSDMDAEESLPSDDDGSEDDYAEFSRSTAGKRRVRRISVSSGSDSEAEKTPGVSKVAKSQRRAVANVQDVHTPSASPAAKPSNISKRRQSSTVQPPAKRVRTESGDDPTRKYCLTKLEEVFCKIFVGYPFLRDQESRDVAPGNDLVPDKRQEDLTDEEKERLESTAKQFAADLEHCLYDLYSELDKSGKRAAAGKYKERFRMLTFNLNKPDRVLLHKRIASIQITPKELSTMSSTDLADEETKLSIKQAEQEALAHSILKKQTLPRAKITHKGIENIEDVNGAAQRDQEREREEAEEERIERERLARLRLQAERARSTSSFGQGSVPPESPVAPQSSSWGAPPPVPAHQLQPDGYSAPSVLSRPGPNPLFVPSASDYSVSVETELNLADLINIDEDLPNDIHDVDTTATPSTDDAALQMDPQSSSTPMHLPSESSLTAPPPSSSSTGISPFAAKPDLTTRPSFDLRSLWTAKEAANGPEYSAEIHTEGSDRQEDLKEPAIDADILVEETDDQDFDMFLNKDDDSKFAPPVQDNSPEAQRAAFEALPKAWTGTLSMPLDATMAQDVSLNARQIGGRMIGHESLLWQALFPSRELRIDGRVPVEKSAQYLTQMRLNPSKELIAVAFSPDPGTGVESNGFHALINHLIAKVRHGLVFPWGNRPKDWAPGRELYIVPLLSSDSIPDYMELLDNLQLPKIRKEDYLVGIWVLNKGKLAPPPVTSGASLNLSAPPLPAIQLPPASPAVMFPYPQHMPTSAPPQPSSSDAALAAEVAQLTPEQIQLMLRTLTSSAMLSAQPAIVPSPQPALPVVPPQPPVQSQAIPIQSWLNTSERFPPAYQSLVTNGSPVAPSGAYPEMRYDAHERDRQYPPGAPYDAPNNRGYRGRGNGPRGRGRGRDHDRSRDTGWPKGRGRGRGPGGASPTRGRGRNEHPRWS